MRFVDSRKTLPRHATKRWKQRRVAEIKGGVGHHTAGGDDPFATARYHTGPNHVSDTGMPGIGYTFFIQQAAVIHWCNDLSDRTWSQGGKYAHPDVDGDGDVDKDDGKGNANGYFVGIVFGGNFNGPGNDTGNEPTLPQVLAFLALWAHITGEVKDPRIPDELWSALGHLSVHDIFSHADFGKAACPGRTLTELFAAFQTHRLSRKRHSDREWQQRLVDAGEDLGSFGPDGNGVDGHWGNTSRQALRLYQESQGLEPTGYKDPATQTLLFDE